MINISSLFFSSLFSLIFYGYQFPRKISWFQFYSFFFVFICLNFYSLQFGLKLLFVGCTSLPSTMTSHPEQFNWRWTELRPFALEPIDGGKKQFIRDNKRRKSSRKRHHLARDFTQIGTSVTSLFISFHSGPPFRMCYQHSTYIYNIYQLDGDFLWFSFLFICH